MNRAVATAAPTRRPAWHVAVCALAMMACTSTNASGTSATGASANGVKSEGDTVYSLDLSKASIVQPIAAAEMIQQDSKFVQIELTQVLNPKRHSLTFDVEYQLPNNERVHLGSFSPFPADMPGKFIVATQGKVRSGGAIVLSMVTPDKVGRGDTVRVTVKKLTFLKG